MAIHKLKKGERLVMVVTNVVLNVPAKNTKYGPSTKFVGRTIEDSDAAFFVDPDTAVRQLARHHLTVETVKGRTIEFAKPGEYIDINLADGAVPVAVTPAASVAAAPATTTGGIVGTASDALDVREKTRRDRICSNMKTAITYFGRKEDGMLMQMRDQGIPYTPETAQELINSLFNALCDARIR